MLKEEAHHMFVGTTGVQRVVERTAELMNEHGTDDVFPHGGIPLDVVQKYLNFQFAVSMDLFGSEQSTNAGNYFTSGLKGRWAETRRKDDHSPARLERQMNVVRDGQIVQQHGARCSARSTSTCATSTSPTARTACAAGTRRSRTPGSTSG
jgi:benzoyl-CoA 2,3-dioxygenase component B